MDVAREDGAGSPQAGAARSRRSMTWWLRVMLYVIFLLAGQTAGTLLGRLYFDKGGNSKWMATFVVSAGFPILLPLLPIFSRYWPGDESKLYPRKPRLSVLIAVYLTIGLLLTGDNLMYSYGLLYLPVSTYSLICASQLAFNAVFSYFLNSQKFTALIVNSLVLLTISASLLAVHSDQDSNDTSKGKYVIGFLCTLGASAAYSLYLSLAQLSFERLIKRETFETVLNMQIYTSLVATCGCVVGLFGSGEWRTLRKEMKNYEAGKVSYLMTLIWTAVAWQVSSIGLLGLIFEASSLFSNVISTVALPLIPVFAVVFFHDRMDGIKAISMILAVWGSLSYVYQHYLDDSKHKKTKTDAIEDAVPRARGNIEMSS